MHANEIKNWEMRLDGTDMPFKVLKDSKKRKPGMHDGESCCIKLVVWDNITPLRAE